MSDIMELIVEYKDAFCDYVISGKRYAEARECYAMLETRLSAMQEVCEKAKGAINPKMIKIHGGKCICAQCELIRVINKLEAIK